MNKFKQIILTLLLCAAGMNAWAYSFVKDGIYYNITSNSAPYTVEVTYKDTNYNSYSGNVVIPESVAYDSKTYSVTTIGGYAFSGCTGLTSVTIPNSVTTIGNYAFCGCTGLTSVTIGNAVTTIKKMAFYGCTGLSTVTIPNSVTSIWSGAFSDCTGLSTVTIGNAVTSIGGGAFSGCTGLSSVTIPNSVTSIDGRAFSGCTGLTSVNFNAINCTHPEDNNGPIFEYCTALTTLNISNQVQIIPDFAFTGCTGLTSITIPNSVTTVGSHVFHNTGWYDNQPDGILYLDGWCLGYKGEKPVGTLSIEEGTIGIAGSAFSFCAISSVVIPNSVKTIGYCAFYGCTLTSIIIPNSVTTIESYAFHYCSSLDTIIALGTTPPTLGGYAFSGISSEAVLFVPCGTTTSYSQQFNMFDPSNIYEECNPYPVTINPTGSTGGEISVSANSAQLGENVEVYVTLEDGYAVESIVAYNANNPSQIVPISLAGAKDVLTYSFVMMPFPVNVEATFRSTEGVSETDGGNIATMLYPNPTNGKVTIEAENMHRVSVFNLMGQKIMESTASGNSFECDMSHYGAGVYMLQIETSNGIATKRVVVER